MEPYLCQDDCDACRNTEEERAICMQARIISDLCQEQGISLEEGVIRYSQEFRERLWNVGIRDRHELAFALRKTNRSAYRVMHFPHGPSKVSFFPAHVLESL